MNNWLLLLVVPAVPAIAFADYILLKRVVLGEFEEFKKTGVISVWHFLPPTLLEVIMFFAGCGYMYFIMTS